MLDRRQLFAASFQMTFLCVLIVAAVGIPLLECTSPLYRRALAHTQLLMPAAVWAIAVGHLSPFLVKLTALLSAFALQAITGTVPGLGGFRPADLRVATPSITMIAATFVALLFAMIFIRKPAWLAASGLIA
ncbi:MAG: hypothetical protein ABSF59_12565 [Candidatus Sulfotelmatobacter sp.]